MWVTAGGAEVKEEEERRAEIRRMIDDRIEGKP